MNKELIKEIIIMFLEEEKEVYKAIEEIMPKKETKEKAKHFIETIDFMKKHIDNYDSTFEKICENLNKKKKALEKLNKIM